jgi:methylthioxylose transferase
MSPRDDGGTRVSSRALPRGAGHAHPWSRALPVAGAAAMALTVAGGLWLARHDGRELGVPFPPFVGRWDPAITAWALAAAALLALPIWAAPRLLALSPAAFAAAVFLLTLALRLALGASSRGTAEWSRVFDPASFEGSNEYLPALTALRYGPGFFLDRFAELVPALPVHAAGHPPGLLLAMDAFGVTTPDRLAAVCIAGGALIAPLTYAVGRAVLDERRARCAGLLTAFAPSVLLFGATSADALYASLGLLAAWPLVSPRPVLRAAGAALLALASLFAWSLLAIGAWAALLAWRRRGVGDMLALALLCAAALLAVHGVLAAVTGFDPIGALRATEQVYRFGIAGERPYWFWIAGSPTAFLLMLGLPTAWLALRALARAGDAAVAIFAVLAIAAVAGFTKAEVERIWLCFAPLVCLAAATALRERHLRPVLAALGAQAVAWEVLWNTVW